MDPGERQASNFAASGHSNQLIAYELGLSEAHVSYLIKNGLANSDYPIAQPCSSTPCARRTPDGLGPAEPRDEAPIARHTRGDIELAAIVKCAVDAIIGFGLDGTIQSWNAAAERCTAMRRKRLSGATSG